MLPLPSEPLITVTTTPLCAEGAGTLKKRLRTGKPTCMTLQGGIDHEKLTGIYKKMIDTLITFMRKKKNKSKDDTRMLYLLVTTGDYVSDGHLSDVYRWYDSADDLA